MLLVHKTILTAAHFCKVSHNVFHHPSFIHRACTVTSLDTSEIICSSRARAGAPKSLRGRSIETVAVPAARASCRPHDDMTVPMMPRLCLCFAAQHGSRKTAIIDPWEGNHDQIVASIRSMHACVNRPGRRPRRGGGRRRRAERSQSYALGRGRGRGLPGGGEWTDERGAARDDRAGKGKERAHSRA